MSLPPGVLGDSYGTSEGKASSGWQLAAWLLIAAGMGIALRGGGP